MAIAIIGYLINDGDTKAIFGTQFAQVFRPALAALAEMKIITCDDMRNAQPFNQLGDDKFISGQIGKCIIEFYAGCEISTKG